MLGLCQGVVRKLLVDLYGLACFYKLVHVYWHCFLRGKYLIRRETQGIWLAFVL